MLIDATHLGTVLGAFALCVMGTQIAMMVVLGIGRTALIQKLSGFCLIALNFSTASDYGLILGLISACLLALFYTQPVVLGGVVVMALWGSISHPKAAAWVKLFAGAIIVPALLQQNTELAGMAVVTQLLSGTCDVLRMRPAVGLIVGITPCLGIALGWWTFGPGPVAFVCGAAGALTVFLGMLKLRSLALQAAREPLQYQLGPDTGSDLP